MLSNLQRKLFWLFSGFFILLSGVSLYYGGWLFSSIPFILLIFYLFLFNLDRLFELIVLLTPLSIQLSEVFPQLGFDLFIPTEPIIAILMLVFLFKIIIKNPLSKSFLLHPVSILIYIYLFWIFLTAITSSLVIVSVKFFIVKLWYILVFYFYFNIWFLSEQKRSKLLFLYLIPLSIVIIYTLIRQSHYGFANFQASHFVMSPFFRDHTIYGAALAFVFPSAIFLFLILRRNIGKKVLSIFFIILVTLGLIFSYTRAAWLSLGIALLAYFVIKWRIRLIYLFLVGITILILGFSFWWNIYYQLENNRQDSSADFEKHIESMSNIATDASNLERINRWKSALRLFGERPILGWGPGSYQFQYAKFQFSYDKTIISTDFGDGGNAHSEYLGLLAESGFLGFLSFVLIIIFTLKSGIKAYYLSGYKADKMMIMGVVLGLVSYYSHSFLNNYLDTDKISVLFWSFTSFLVSTEIQLKKKSQ